MHRNPVKRGLVDRPDLWVWSGFRFYAYGQQGPVKVQRLGVGLPRRRNERGRSHPLLVARRTKRGLRPSKDGAPTGDYADERGFAAGKVGHPPKNRPPLNAGRWADNVRGLGHDVQHGSKRAWRRELQTREEARGQS